ncbi:hypothetical protein F5884DRAFT_797760 [Xylogone sp. PMI_703]|nr:hypothetical protein F5884DRAFT_797760 [Xylogone sp. PMI_703]
MSDGTLGGPSADDNPLGLVYRLNFSTPFHTSDNISNILTTISKASGGSGNANNIGPNYIDGAMFANDFEWFIYGGELQQTSAFRLPGADSVASYQVYPSGPPKNFQPGFILGNLPDGVTRYITDGAAVSIPSENLGVYFGGLRSPSWGPFYYTPSNESVNANFESTRLITVDMTNQNFETWTNKSIPSSVPGRANAEIAWVPVSEQGILVAIGGVLFPEYAEIGLFTNASATATSKRISPTFMSTVSVFDVANKTWYNQPTSGDVPPALTQGCTVVASADDGTSHNIYWYGGFDGLDATSTFNDDVYVLSVPSFIWTKVYSGNGSHGRASHKCVKPYPDQMIVVGGYPSLPGVGLTCLEDNGIVQIFNLSSATWLNSYDPTKWSNYTVPSAVVKAIGGSPTGGATKTAPSPSGFANRDLTTIFDAQYNASKITTWYPYSLHTEPPPTNRTALPTPVVHNSSGLPKYVGPVLGVVLGLFFITVVILAWMLWRRRRLLRSSTNGTPSEMRTIDNRRWVTNWLLGNVEAAKAPTVTSDDTPQSPYMEEEPSTVTHHASEVGGTEVRELDATSHPVELDATGFVPINRHMQTQSPTQVSPPPQSPPVSPSAPSPPLPSPTNDAEAGAAAAAAPRVNSDVSNLSEGTKAHLRGISDSSVSTEGGAWASRYERLAQDIAAVPSALEEQQAGNDDPAPSVVSSLTPPAATPAASTGETNTRPWPQNRQPSTARRSQFSEGLDENEGK